jgi:flagellar biosynthesis/type III secretory pathway protein FliH
LAGQAALRGVSGWKPLEPLKPIELQNAGFVQQNFMRAKPANFALWTVEEQLAASKLAEATSADNGIEDAEIKSSGAEVSEGHDLADTPVSSLDAEAIEKIKSEAYARGLEEGQRMAQAEAAEQAAQAQSNSLEELASQANQLLVNIEQGVLALQEKPEIWHEPLKRLALHLAEQLTLTELSISSNGVQNLIDRCIETLDVQSVSSVVVELNPNDMALLQNHKAMPGEQMPTWRMVSDSHLLPGSVRVRADDAVVSDLIEHRLEGLATVLLQNTKPWQAQTAFQPERLSARRGKAETVEDALPRETQAVNLSSLDLPNLDLDDVQVKSDDRDIDAVDDPSSEPNSASPSESTPGASND